MTFPTWKAVLSDTIAPELGREIDIFETQIELRKQGKIDEKLFAETRLRRGAYGQRYDNGQRHDGSETQTLVYPEALTRGLTKGPSTLWDAPGMHRIKIPFGRVTADQMDELAAVAEEHSDGILHVTTRQDFQLHFVHIDDTPTLMRRLASVGITTREACGNTVRNITACPYAGVCADEAFDVTPYADASTWFLLGHQDTQDFGRKFKVAFSGCKQHACGLTSLHDLGAIAVKKIEDGKTTYGFEIYVGGGLGAVPHQAKLFDNFLSEEELLPMAQAIARVFARLGEKKNRQRARLKFLVAKLGLEEFRRLVLEERARLPADGRWTSYLEHGPTGERPADLASLDRPLRPPSALPPGPHGEAFEAWRRTNLRPQRQPGYVVATVRLPLGDLTSDQMRALASLARLYTGDTVRTTVEQNLVFRWVAEGDLPALHRQLDAIGLGTPGAGTIGDITACPGTDTCKLGISSSRGLAAELGSRFAARSGSPNSPGSPTSIDPAVENLHIKTSGCFNACGQHHIADLGFLGVSRNVRGRRVPHFQVVLGGKWTENAGAYGLAIGAVPSKRIPDLVDRLTALYVAERHEGERFQAFIQRTGKAAIRGLLEDLMEVPSHDADPTFYSDWGDPREYTIGDMGEGECAGEIVSPVQFGLSASEREVFEAQLYLDQGDAARAADLAYRSMVNAARTLVRVEYQDVADDADVVVAEFRARLYETHLFQDPFAGDKFANYLLRIHAQQKANGEVPAPVAAAGGPSVTVTAEAAHHRIEEAQLFIEAAHACYDRMSQRRAS